MKKKEISQPNEAELNSNKIELIKRELQKYREVKKKDVSQFMPSKDAECPKQNINQPSPVQLYNSNKQRQIESVNSMKTHKNQYKQLLYQQFPIESIEQDRKETNIVSGEPREITLADIHNFEIEKQSMDGACWNEAMKNDTFREELTFDDLRVKHYSAITKQQIEEYQLTDSQDKNNTDLYIKNKKEVLEDKSMRQSNLLSKNNITLSGKKLKSPSSDFQCHSNSNSNNKYSNNSNSTTQNRYSNISIEEKRHNIGRENGNMSNLEFDFKKDPFVAKENNNEINQKVSNENVNKYLKDNKKPSLTAKRSLSHLELVAFEDAQVLQQQNQQFLSAGSTGISSGRHQDSDKGVCFLINDNTNSLNSMGSCKFNSFGSTKLDQFDSKSIESKSNMSKQQVAQQQQKQQLPQQSSSVVTTPKKGVNIQSSNKYPNSTRNNNYSTLKNSTNMTPLSARKSSLKQKENKMELQSQQQKQQQQSYSKNNELSSLQQEYFLRKKYESEIENSLQSNYISMRNNSNTLNANKKNERIFHGEETTFKDDTNFIIDDDDNNAHDKTLNKESSSSSSTYQNYPQAFIDQSKKAYLKIKNQNKSPPEPYFKSARTPKNVVGASFSSKAVESVNSSKILEFGKMGKVMKQDGSKSSRIINNKYESNFNFKPSIIGGSSSNVNKWTQEKGKWKEFGSDMVDAYEDLTANFNKLLIQKKEQDLILLQLTQSLQSSTNSNSTPNLLNSTNSMFQSQNDNYNEDGSKQEQELNMAIQHLQPKLFNKFDRQESMQLQTILKYLSKTQKENKELNQKYANIELSIAANIKSSSQLADQIIHLRTQLDKACLTLLNKQKEESFTFPHDKTIKDIHEYEQYQQDAHSQSFFSDLKNKQYLNHMNTSSSNNNHSNINNHNYYQHSSSNSNPHHHNRNTMNSNVSSGSVRADNMKFDEELSPIQQKRQTSSQNKSKRKENSEFSSVFNIYSGYQQQEQTSTAMKNPESIPFFGEQNQKMK